MILRVKQEFGQGFSELGFTDACWPQEEEGTIRTVRVRQTGTRTTNRFRYQTQRFLLTDHALMQIAFHLQQLGTLAFHHLGDRNTRCPRHDLGNFFGTDFGTQQFVLGGFGIGGIALALGRLQLGFQLRQLAVLQLGQFVELTLALQLGHLQAQLFDFFADMSRTLQRRFLGAPDFIEVGVFLTQRVDLFLDQRQALLRSFVLFLLDGFALDLELDQTTVELVHLLRLGVDFHLDLGGGFVDQVDGLVRQEAVSDVTVRKLGGGNNRRVGNLDAVVHFVAFLQTAQNGDGRFDRRFFDHHLLETTLEGSVFFDVLAVFIQRGGADAVQFATRQRGLQHIPCVHGTFGFTSANHGVDFVDEENDLAFFGGNILKHGFQALFELTPVFSTRQQRGHIQRQHLLALEGFRHFFVDDALGQPFNNSRLTDTGFTDENRVVLAATLQDLDRTADFVVTTDHRVELTQTGALGEVEAIFLEGFALAFGVGRIDALTAAHGLNGQLQRLAVEPVIAAETAGFALVITEGKQKEFGGDELVATLGSFLVAEVEQVAQIARGLHFATGALHLRQTLHECFGLTNQRGHIDAGTFQQ